MDEMMAFKGHTLMLSNDVVKCVQWRGEVNHPKQIYMNIFPYVTALQNISKKDSIKQYAVTVSIG